MNTVAYWLGLTNPSGGPYLWWSGFGGRVTLGGALIIGYLRAHRCHEPGCWHAGRFPDGPYRKCARHHSTVPNTGPPSTSTSTEGASCL